MYTFFFAHCMYILLFIFFFFYFLLYFCSTQFTIYLNILHVLENFYFRIPSYAFQCASEGRHTLVVAQISPYLNYFFLICFLKFFLQTQINKREIMKKIIILYHYTDSLLSFLAYGEFHLT